MAGLCVLLLAKNVVGTHYVANFVVKLQKILIHICVALWNPYYYGGTGDPCRRLPGRSRMRPGETFYAPPALILPKESVGTPYVAMSL